MSYTLNIEPSIMKEAESCQSQQKQALQIGAMKDEINLPDNFDDVFDSLDHEVASMFNGSLA